MAELPVKVLSRTVTVPPPSLARPPPTVAELPEKTLSLTVNVPKLSMPPPLPLPALPPAIVRPEIVTVSPDSTLKTRRGVVAADGQLVGAGAVDRQVVRDVEFAAGQGDRAGQSRLEGDDVGAGVGVGLGDGVAQRAGDPVGQGRDVESRQDQAALQLFQGQASTGRAWRGRRGGEHGPGMIGARGKPPARVEERSKRYPGTQGSSFLQVDVPQRGRRLRISPVGWWLGRRPPPGDGRRVPVESAGLAGRRPAAARRTAGSLRLAVEDVIGGVRHPRYLADERRRARRGRCRPRCSPAG